MSVQTNINRLCAIYDFEPVIGLFAVPGARHEIDVIVYAVLDVFYFQPAETAVIGDSGEIGTVILFVIS